MPTLNFILLVKFSAPTEHIFNPIFDCFANVPLRTILEKLVEFMQNYIMLLLTCGAKSTYNFL